MIKHIQKIFVFAFLFVALACGKKAEEVKTEPAAQAPAATQSVPPKSGKGMGVVTKIAPSGKFITLDHNDIPDIMEAMAMEYPVQSPDLLKGINLKDSVSFTLTKTPESQYMVTEIHKK